jgi:hypothetical protein
MCKCDYVYTYDLYISVYISDLYIYVNFVNVCR